MKYSSLGLQPKAAMRRMRLVLVSPALLLAFSAAGFAASNLPLMKHTSSFQPPLAAVAPARISLSLDGQWGVAESMEAMALPQAFPGTAPVPGLVNLAQPGFPQVDEFESYELNQSRIRHGKLPESARVPPPGRSLQPRNYFWYRTTFRAPTGKTSGWLTIEKAQFGMAVWLNGHLIGEEPACFSAGRFELTTALRWGDENELIVRIGAHPGVLPASYPAGTDFEKFKWTPGIYDSVSVAFCDDPVIMSVQVAPRLAPRAIVVQTKLANRSSHTCIAQLRHRVSEWRGFIRFLAGHDCGISLQLDRDSLIGLDPGQM